MSRATTSLEQKEREKKRNRRARRGRRSWLMESHLAAVIPSTQSKRRQGRPFVDCSSTKTLHCEFNPCQGLACCHRVFVLLGTDKCWRKKTTFNCKPAGCRSVRQPLCWFSREFRYIRTTDVIVYLHFAPQMESRIEELERELKETSAQLALTREQLRLQSRRARQLVAACSTKVEEKEREMRMLRALKDGQLQSIVRKLLHFESLLRQEQKRVVDIVRQKDNVIYTQSTELEQLRQANRKLLMAANQDHDQDSSASKMAKLDPENKENVGHKVQQAAIIPQMQAETPLVTKMVRRFEPAPSAAKKPEVPKKPARLLVSSTTSIVSSTIVQQQQQTTSVSKGVVRTDSVNDHGYFTLEKRKPVRMSVSVTPTPVPVTETKSQNPTPRDPPSADHVADEMDLRNNFEEFHLMDSLEEEEQQQQQQHLFHSESNVTTPPRTPDRSSGDGAEWNSSSGGSSLQMTPPHNGLGDCTSLSISAGSVQILPQLGDATPTSGVQFDRFLDVSGLTQKSILTPSRLLSNHKNMLKPKDVKHRHMINKATHAHAPNSSTSVLLGFNCRSSESLLLSGDPARLHHHPTNQVRYYVEPFLWWRKRRNNNNHQKYIKNCKNGKKKKGKETEWLSDGPIVHHEFFFCEKKNLWMCVWFFFNKLRRPFSEDTFVMIRCKRGRKWRILDDLDDSIYDKENDSLSFLTCLFLCMCVCDNNLNLHDSCRFLLSKVWPFG